LKVAVKTVHSWMKQVDVEVPYDEVEPHLEKVFRKFQRTINLDGFRKGKVPLSIIRQRYGDAVKADAAEDLMQIFFQKAVETEQLKVVAPARARKIEFEEGKPFSFSLDVEVRPDIEVRTYSDFKVEKSIRKVTDEDVEQSLRYLREQRAELKPVSDGARSGHILQGDVQALDSSGVPLLGQHWEDRVLVLGEPPLTGDAAEVLNGVREGESRKFRLTGSGREGQTHDEWYSLTVKSIQEKILPSMDDGFARSIGEYENLTALKEALRKRLTEQWDEEGEVQVQHRIADEIIRRNDFELPPAMVENMLDSLWENYKDRDQNMEREDFFKENRPDVIWNLKWNLIQEKIAEQENLRVTDSDLDEEIERLAGLDSKNEKKIRAFFTKTDERSRLKDRMLGNKIMDLIKSRIKIKEVTVKSSKRKSDLIV